jgi:hypothetical protein
MSEQEELFKTKVETAVLDFLEDVDQTCSEAKITLDYFLSDKRVMEVFAKWLLNKQIKSNTSVSTATQSAR